MKQKSIRLYSRAALLLMMLLTTATAWAENVTVSYIDADGQTQSVSATVLTGSESDLGSDEQTTWYVVNSNISHSGKITFYGNVNIILADGYTMTTSSDDDGIYGFGATLTIYGQTLGSGTLEATSGSNANTSAITANGGGTFTINGGTVNASATAFNGNGIGGTVTINGGTVNASATASNGTGIGGKLTINGGTVNATGYSHGIYTSGNVTINGGRVTITGNSYGIYAGGTITLGLTGTSDFITANSYYKAVNIKSDQRLTDGTNFYTGTNVSIPNAVTLRQANFTDNGDGSYTIWNAYGWDGFCDLLEGNDKGFFDGKTVKLNGDITVSRMAGASHHDFTGIFDGNQKTLTFNYTTSAENAAPFQYVENATIKNLHVAGTIQTSNKYAAGIIAQQYGSVTIQNCQSSVIIKSSTSGDGTHGGFVAVNNNGTLTIEGCVFDGKIVRGSDTFITTDCGGFVGWKNNSGTLTITNSLYAPQTDAKAVSSGATFARNWTMPADANCYYTRTLGTAQGKQAHTITAGEHVSVANAGDATNYSVSGITSYGTGIKYGDVLYAGSGDVVSLTLSNNPLVGCDFSAYTASAGTLSGSDNPYTLTMPDEDVTIGATFVEWTYYTINDWDTFCDWIKNDYDNYKDKHYKLGADVSATKMVGDKSHPFCGTFDGQGHTLTVSYSENSLFIAPFRYVSGTSSAPVVIKNLHIAGTITNQNKYIGGMVGRVLADGYVTIENCRSSVDIVSTYEENDCRLSGIVSRGDENTTINIKGSVFDGSINAASSGRCAGFFVSWNSSTTVNVSIQNCLFAPTAITVVGNDHKTFAPSKNVLTNCYYTQTLGGAQGEEGILLYDSGVPATANAGVISRCNGEKYRVKLQGRTLTKDGNWNTLTLPFAITNFTGTRLAGATVKELNATTSNLNNGVLTLNFNTVSSIEAGKPYIVKWETTGDNIVNPVFQGVTITSTTPTAVNFTGGSFVGQYSPFSIVNSGATSDNQGNKNEIIMMSTGNRIGYSQNPRTLKCFRCHFLVPTSGGQNEARSFVLDFGEGETTALTLVNSEKRTVNSDIYDLQGRKVAKPTTKGLYIVNGRKTVIK